MSELQLVPNREVISAVDLEHELPFDPTHGYTLTQMLEIDAPSEPEGYVAFWQATWAEAMNVDLRLSCKQLDSPWEGVELYEVAYDSLGGVRIGGWLTVPNEVERIERGLVCGHGYGGRGAPELHVHARRQVTIMPCARGFNLSAHEDLPDFSKSHVVHGIENRETYIHRGCVADYWLAGSVLLAMYPQVAGCLDYIGNSFGGGIGAMLLPWDNRIRQARLGVPSFGNHPLRLTLPCVGSGEAVQAYHEVHPEVVDVLAFFDAATAARRISVPVFFDCALFDPSVPPPGQFAVHNACPQPKMLHVRQTGHFDTPQVAAEDARSAEALDRFFGIDGEG